MNLFYCKRYKVAFLNQYTIFGGLHKIACGEKSKFSKGRKKTMQTGKNISQKYPTRKKDTFNIGARLVTYDILNRYSRVQKLIEQLD